LLYPFLLHLLPNGFFRIVFIFIGSENHGWCLSTLAFFVSLKKINLELILISYYLSGMGNKKLLVGGKVADKQFPLRTTDEIYDFYIVRAGEKNTSVNVIMNIALSQYKNKFKSKKP
jgi:hypothetical protein